MARDACCAPKLLAVHDRFALVGATKFALVGATKIERVKRASKMDRDSSHFWSIITCARQNMLDSNLTTYENLPPKGGIKVVVDSNETGQAKSNGAGGGTPIGGFFRGLNERSRRVAEAISQAVAGFNVNGRLIAMIVAGILGAVVLLWIVDKVAFYYVAKTYVEQVSQILDLNEHLANALVLLTFIIAVFFARLIWAFSKTKRLVGVAGISALLILHSLVLWYGTRDSYFSRSGVAIKCYVLTREGKVTFGEHVGIDPATGRLCRPVTAEMLERLKEYETGKRPRPIVSSNPIFFDPRTGEPIVWYNISKNHEVELYDLMGFDPNSGEELLPVTKDIVEQWKKSQAFLKHIPKAIDPEKFVFFDPRNGQPRAWYWKSASGAYEFYDSPGFQPRTGDRLLLVTREVINNWKNSSGSGEKLPQRIDPNAYPFFDPKTGAAQAWYWRGEDGRFEFYDAPGFQPRTGDKLSVVTRDIAEQWKKAITQQKPITQQKRSEIKPQGGASLEFLAQRFLENHFRISEAEPSDVLDYIQRTYASEVEYFGSRYTRQKVLEEQRRYLLRWPQRSFRIIPEKSHIICDAQRSYCDISSQLHFSVSNPINLRTSAGITTNEMRVVFSNGMPSIESENGTVISRQISTPQAAQVPQFQSVPDNRNQNDFDRQQAEQMIRGVFGTIIQGMGR